MRNIAGEGYAQYNIVSLDTKLMFVSEQRAPTAVYHRNAPIYACSCAQQLFIVVNNTIRSLEDRVPLMVLDHSNSCHPSHYQIKEMHRFELPPFTFEKNGWWVGKNYGIGACRCSGCVSI